MLAPDLNVHLAAGLARLDAVFQGVLDDRLQQQCRNEAPRRPWDLSGPSR